MDQIRDQWSPLSRVDRRAICGVFTVTSDEEGSFQNDLFSVIYDPDAPSAATTNQANNPADFFKDLVSLLLLENNPSLDGVTNGSYITTVLNALVEAPSTPAPPADAYQIST